MKVAIINYGMGNLASVKRALEDIGADPFIAEHPSSLYDAHKIILPGVGAFSEGMERLRSFGWEKAIQDVVQIGKTFLGICLGMQMLASRGEEGGETKGLNLIPGSVIRLDKIGCSLRIPHVGWNEVIYDRESEIFSKIPNASDFYFVHSYFMRPITAGDVLLTADYGEQFVAAVAKENIVGLQFHPEKSHRFGMTLLKNFVEKC